MKQKNLKLTVSIGIPAFNEEKNIYKILKSLVEQKEETVQITEIILISDGSTDNTVKYAENLNDKRIKIVDDHQRLGQPARIAQLLSIFTSEILVLMDADLLIESEYFIENLTSKFSNKNIGLVAAHARPLSAKNLLETAINNYRLAREWIKEEFDYCQTIYGAHACLAYSKQFAEKLHIPPEILSVDSYSFLSCAKLEFEFLHVEDAVIYYRSPQSIKDQISQSTRHLAGGIQLNKYFDTVELKNAFYVPLTVSIKIMLFQMSHNLLGYLLLKLINSYCIYKSHRIYHDYNVQWNFVGSTK